MPLPNDTSSRHFIQSYTHYTHTQRDKNTLSHTHTDTHTHADNFTSSNANASSVASQFQLFTQMYANI